MKFRAVCICVPAVLSLLLSCKKDSAPTVVQTPQPLPILPLKVGNQWSYRVTTYDQTGHTTQVANSTEFIARDTVIQNERWYFWNQANSICTNRTDGYWEMNLVQSLYAKYPARQNDTYRFGTDALTFWNIRVASIDTLVSVPYGVISCYAYEWRQNQSDSPRMVLFLSPGKGIIREDIYVPPFPGNSGYLLGRIELTSTNIN